MQCSIKTWPVELLIASRYLVPIPDAEPGQELEVELDPKSWSTETNANRDRH